MGWLSDVGKSLRGKETSRQAGRRHRDERNLAAEQNRIRQALMQAQASGDAGQMEQLMREDELAKARFRERRAGDRPGGFLGRTLGLGKANPLMVLAGAAAGLLTGGMALPLLGLASAGIGATLGGAAGGLYGGHRSGRESDAALSDARAETRGLSMPSLSEVFLQEAGRQRREKERSDEALRTERSQAARQEEDWLSQYLSLNPVEMVNKAKSIKSKQRTSGVGF